MKRMMFRTRLILIFVLALVIQGALIGFFSNYYATEIVMKNKRGDMADMINLVDININAKVRYMTELIDNTASSYTVKNMLSSEQYYDSMMFQDAFISEYFENLDSSFGAVNNVIILKDSKVILNRNADQEVALVESPDQEACCQAAVRQPDRVMWNGIVDSLVDMEGKGQRQKVISASRAIVDEETGLIMGVILVELDPENFSSMLLNSQNTFQNQYTFVVDKNRNIVCSNKKVNTGWIDTIVDNFDNRIRRFDMSWDGEDYFVCGQYNGVTGWKTFSVIGTNYIFPETNILQSFIISIVAVCTFSVSVIIAAISYTMTRPVNQLSRAMEKVQEGDFSIQLSNHRKDEMGQLIDSFNFMTNKINALIREVYQEKIAQKNAEMEALEAQINPHFISNTLDSINWMLIDKGEDEISEVIISLGKLMKYCVDKNNGIVTLGQEIEYVMSYLHIQKNRLEERLNYEIRVPEDLKVFRVPKLILQPLVENSIIHGIEPYKRGGLVTIQAYDTGRVLFIVVEDNGHGMDGESLEKLKKNLREPDENYTSIGVQNVDRRIRMHYGEAYKLEIDSRLGEGTRIKIKIPKQSEEESGCIL